MIFFQYKRIDKSLIRELKDKIRAGTSIVLLGARYGGKRYVADRLRLGMKEDPVGPVLSLRFLSDPPVANREQVRRGICSETALVGGKFEPDLPNWELLAPIDALHSQLGKKIVLFAANVDAMAHHLARSFLADLQTRIHDHAVVAFLTAESDFGEITHGPGSEFNCAEYYVLQGFAEDEFGDLVRDYAGTIHLQFTDRDAACHQLWERTGGNLYLLRLLLATVQETRARRPAIRDTPVGVEEFQVSPDPVEIPGVSWTHVLRHAVPLLDREPGCWEDLDRLIRDEPVEVALAERSPGPLELAGVAVRTKGRLEFSSPLMADFIRKRYSDVHFGDLYARDSEWDKAFARYSHRPPKERLRPASIEDRVETETTVNALSAALHSAAPGGPFPVMRLFAQGCRLVLGFPEVVFWRRGREWEQFKVEGVDSGQAPLERIKRILPPGDVVSPDWLPVPSEWNRCAAAMILDALPPDQRWAVTVSDLGQGTVISRERERLLRDLFRHFRQAQAHAVGVVKDRERLQTRDRHIEIINSVFSSLGGDVQDAGQVLRMAARGLRTLGYRRVLFCLVDPRRERIEGVLDDSDDPSVNVAEMTDWALRDPLADLQPYVIDTRTYKIVDDGATEPLTNKEVVRAAKLKGAACVPMLNRSGEVIGTIQVERKDGAAPTREAAEDLLVFGRLLATAIEQSERVNLLQSSLDKVPEPILIVDSLERCRYANQPAADLFQMTPGWRNPGDARTLSGEGTDKLRDDIRTSLTQARVFHHIEGLGRDPSYRGAVLCEHIRDWRDNLAGALAHVQDMNYLNRVLEAFGMVAAATDTPSAMEAMLDATKLLGHKWGRLYLIDEHDPDRFVSRRSFGFDNKEVEERFSRGEMGLPSRTEQSFETWKCINERRPLVFHYDPNKEDGDALTAPYGLEAVVVKNHHCPPEFVKRPGDYWIDNPLLASEKDLGKLTLQCDGALLPEHFEMLKVLFGMASELLGAFLRREHAAAEHAQVLRQSSERSLSSIAHNILTQFGSFSPLLNLYRRHEANAPGLTQVNDIFENALTRLSRTASRTKRLISSVTPKPETFDLVAHVKAAGRAGSPEAPPEIECAEGSVLVKADPHLLESAMLELIANSREMISDPANLRVTINIESGRPTQGWVTIAYADNGPGIPEELRERIFEGFFSHRPGRERSTGLGMWYVRRIVTAHGGAIRAEGQAGQGATFVIEIPVSGPSAPTKED